MAAAAAAAPRPPASEAQRVRESERWSHHKKSSTISRSMTWASASGCVWLRPYIHSCLRFSKFSPFKALLSRILKGSPAGPQLEAVEPPECEAPSGERGVQEEAP